MQPEPLGEHILQVRPFLKWAGGKRWLVERSDFHIPEFDGRYIEPFLGGGAMFFGVSSRNSLISDVNEKLIEVYKSIRDNHSEVIFYLSEHQAHHSQEYYYRMRSLVIEDKAERAAQFLYLNRTCWNGLYRENLKGQFNVPIGTKSKIAPPDEDWVATVAALQGSEICCCDFEKSIDRAESDDLLFIDPPYTTAHNFNGFVKYNQKIFTWDDQIRLRDSVARAVSRGAKALITNADHPSVISLYEGVGVPEHIARASVISGKNAGRQNTTELIIRCNI
jgi:DNA adenine methylase